MADEKDLWKETLRLAKQIPKGRVSTYKALAIALGSEKLSRLVGMALGGNTNPAEVPCHRVVCSDGKIGGYKWGVAKKAMLLKREGVIVKEGRITDFNKILFRKLKKIK